MIMPGKSQLPKPSSHWRKAAPHVKRRPHVLISRRKRSCHCSMNTRKSLRTLLTNSVGIEGLFDAEAAGAIVRQTAASVLGAKPVILDQMRFMAAELRREPPPRAPE